MDEIIPIRGNHVLSVFVCSALDIFSWSMVQLAKEALVVLMTRLVRLQWDDALRGSSVRTHAPAPREVVVESAEVAAVAAGIRGVTVELQRVSTKRGYSDVFFELDLATRVQYALNLNLNLEEYNIAKQLRNKLTKI
ncbi:cytochrome c-552 [Striga asiatica]|uniref:Cytochrome c-552 n=1 Tax=Striga asiatica TaxID=4170 RepID=A0A5A7PSF1_STRAF|nr:cytochrome c-552 [Striga asiatica]